MKKFLHLIVVIACLCLPIKSAGQVLTDFYNYTYGAVTLNDNFRNQLNKASGGVYTSGDYTWKTGDPLPNPAPNGMYNGEPVTSMKIMFMNCLNLTSLDLSKFDTSNVTDMNCMFYLCSALTSLNISNFNTSKVTNMYSMFQNCNNLTNLDVSNFDTSNVTNMTYMFYTCTNLTSLNLSKFDTSKVTNMSMMFTKCSSLTSLNVSSFNTSNVTDMNSMFGECKNLNSLNLSNFDTSKVKDMGWMFSGCTELTSLNLSGFDTSNLAANKMYGIFSNCGKSINGVAAKGLVGNPETAARFNNQSETKIDATRLIFDLVDILQDFYNYTLSGDGYKVTLTDAFKTALGTGNFVGVNGGKWTTGEPLPNPAPNGMYGGKPVIDMSSMFQGCSATVLDLSNWNTSNVTDFGSMFDACANLTSLNISNFKTSKATSMGAIFRGCGALTNLDVSMFNTSNVTNMGAMFQSCGALTNIDVSKFDTSKATSMGYMFYGCSKLTSLNLSKFNTANVTNMGYMFQEDNGLTGLDLSNFDTSNVTDMGYMFRGCTGLTNLNLSNWNTAKVTTMAHMFYWCKALPTLDLSSFEISNTTNLTRTFLSCGKTEGSGQATIGTVKDWNTAYLLNNSGTSTSGSYINKSTLKFGVADMYKDLDYVLFQDSDGSNKSATIVAPSATPYSGAVTIADSVMVGADKYPVIAVAPEAFKECSSLSSVDISKNITKVGDNAFTGAASAINLNMHMDTPPAVTDIAFDDEHYTSTILTVHDKTKADYVAHEVWGKFTNMPTGIDNAHKDNSGINVARIPNGVIVSGVEAGETVKLFSGAGALIRSVKASDSSVSIDGVQSGMYIVTVGANAVKVVI